MGASRKSGRKVYVRGPCGISCSHSDLPIGGHKAASLPHVFGQDLMSRWRNFDVKTVSLPWKWLSWCSLNAKLWLLQPNVALKPCLSCTKTALYKVKSSKIYMSATER